MVRESRRWRDGKGIVHVLRAIEGIALDSGDDVIYGWRPRCGYARRSDVEHARDLTVTCMACAALDV